MRPFIRPIPCAPAGDPPGGAAAEAAPMAVPETGMHVAMINRAAISADDRLLLTVSDDKTARLWTLPDLEPAGVLRPPADAGDKGKLYACALSPDGRHAAVGGYTGGSGDYSAYLFATDSQRLVRRLTGLPRVIHHLAFSPDGRRLAAGLGGSRGARVWTLDGPATPEALVGYNGSVYGLGFSRDGRLATVCDDGTVRLYDPSLSLVASAAMEGEPFSVAFSPDGTMLALGFFDKAMVEIRRADGDLTLVHRAELGAEPDLGTVAWALNGATVVAAGSYGSSRSSPVVLIPADGKGRNSELDCGIGDTVMAVIPLGDGTIVAAGGGPTLLRADARGTVLGRRSPASIDFRGATLRVAADGGCVAVAKEDETGWFFDVRERSLAPGGREATILPSAGGPGFDVRDWKNALAPTLNGRKLEIEKEEGSRSVAVAGNRLLLGSEWWLRAYDGDAVLLWRAPAPGVAWAVNLSPDGRLAVAAFGDGTIRWYRAEDGVLLLTLFVHVDGRRWAAWTPGGYYAASAGGEELFGWHMDNGPDREADFHPASKFRDRFYRPEVISAILDTLDEAEAVARALAPPVPLAEGVPPVAAPPLPRGGAGSMPPPSITVHSPADGAEHSDGKVPVSFRVVARGDTMVATVEIEADGVLQYSESPEQDDFEDSILLDLSGGETNLVISAVNQFSVREEVRRRVVLRDGRPARRPDLRILVVGIDRYPPEVGELQFAAKDARAFLDAMRDQQGLLYGQVLPQFVIDQPGSKARIEKGLCWLEDKAQPGDVSMIFLAGHGTSVGDHFHFVTNDPPGDDLGAYSVSGQTIIDAMRRIKGKRLLFIDACRCGAIGGDMPRTRARAPNVDRFINDLMHAGDGAVVLSASSPGEFSYEYPDIAHGAFTHALVAGLRGAAARPEDGLITFSRLVTYVCEEVARKTGDKQNPHIGTMGTVANLPLAVVEVAKAPEPQPEPA